MTIQRFRMRSILISNNDNTKVNNRNICNDRRQHPRSDSLESLIVQQKAGEKLQGDEQPQQQPIQLIEEQSHQPVFLPKRSVHFALNNQVHVFSDGVATTQEIEQVWYQSSDYAAFRQAIRQEAWDTQPDL